jgi:hypothetical protein
MGDYLALIDAVFNQFFKFMVQYVTAKCSGASPEWTHIPQAVRWETGTVKKGKFSEIYSVIIP